MFIPSMTFGICGEDCYSIENVLHSQTEGGQALDWADRVNTFPNTHFIAI